MGAPPIGPPDVSSLLNDSPTGCLRVSDHCLRNRAVRIFISYAAEQRSIAESLAVSLRQAGHEVYSDRDTLPDSDAHLARIRDEISRCDLFVFLVSDASLEESSYARMELDLARSRWPEPSVHVLPVIVQHPSVEMPDYLSVATLIEPAGNLVADTLASIAGIATRLAPPRVAFVKEIDLTGQPPESGASAPEEREGTTAGTLGPAGGLPRRRPSSKRSTSTGVPKAPKPPRQQQRGQEPRWILARAFDLSTKRPKKPTPAFRAGAKHEVQVIIGADQPDWLVARGRDPSQSIDSMLPIGSHVLTVIFFRPDSGVQTRKLTLPPSGPSPKPAKFRFDVGPAGSRIEALISIVHRGCVLQTAMLSGLAVDDPTNAPQEARLALRLQVVVPGFAELDRRQGFDAALVTGRAASSNAVAAGFVHSGPDTGKTLCFRQPRIDKAAQSIRATLEDVVTDESLHGGLRTKAAQALLWKLAQHGRILYECIGQRLEKELAGRDLSRLQLVQTDPSAFIPIEFVYDLPPPANGAPLCRNWQAALSGRPCTANHHKVDALGHLAVVCPSGFWGVSKVIERQILEDLTAEELANSDFGLRAEPTTERPSLPPIGSALFAWSEILDNAVPGTSAAILESLDRATAKHAASVSTWLKWAEAVDQRHPALLVLLSHTVDDALEIGPENSGERATLAQINSRYVKKLAQDAPIVFLLGCDTAVTDNKLVSFVGRFRDQGAALVVGTITPVLGERAAAVVKAVVSQLAQKRKRPASFGELMRDARRDLLSRGELTALCATSFGDASWLVS